MAHALPAALLPPVPCHRAVPPDPVKKVYLVEDHPAVRQAYAALFAQASGFEVVGAASTPEEALRDLPAARPDLALVDVSLPGMDGITLVRELRPLAPGVRFLMVSGHEETVYAERALAAGASGFVMKDQGISAILSAARRVLEGDVVVSERVRPAAGGT